MWGGVREAFLEEGAVCELAAEDDRVWMTGEWRGKALCAMETTWKKARAVLEM